MFFFKKECSRKTAWRGLPFVSLKKNFHSVHTKEDTRVFRPFLLYLNTQAVPFSSLSIRKALGLVIDRQKIISNCFQHCEPLLSIFSANPISKPDLNLKEGQIRFATGLKELNMKKEKFPPIVFSYCKLPEEHALALYLKTTWEQAFGIQVVLRKHDWNKLCQQVEQGRAHATGFFSSALTVSPFSFFYPFCRKETNLSQWESIRYVNKFCAAKREKSLAKRKRKLEELEKLLLEQAPIIPLVKRKYLYQPDPRLKNYVVDLQGAVDFRFASIQNKPD